MKVVVDNKIPYLAGVLEEMGIDVVYLPGAAIKAMDVYDADALFVRTRTHCNKELLEGSSIQFIVTATIGYDHLDTEYLQRAGIKWTNCPGCNASSVAQYIHSSLLILSQLGLIDLPASTVGIIGVGHVGKEVEKVLLSLGCDVMLNDPPREEAGETGFQHLQELAEKCDVLTFHTPLISNGIYPTYHLADDIFFRMLKKQPIIINSGRGEVVDNNALLSALKEGFVKQAVIDTWEDEPLIDRELLKRVVIGTPHIAGYSADGKANATRMSLQAFCDFFGFPKHFLVNPPSLPDSFVASDNPVKRALQLYDPRRDSDALKSNPDMFEWLRGNYPLRREKWN